MGRIKDYLGEHRVQIGYIVLAIATAVGLFFTNQAVREANRARHDLALHLKSEQERHQARDAKLLRRVCVQQNVVKIRLGLPLTSCGAFGRKGLDSIR